MRVDVGTSVARNIIIPALPGFFDRYPDIQLDLGVSDRPIDLISENVDCVLRAGDLQEQSLVARRIGNIHLLTVASPGYIQRYGMPAHPRELEAPGKHHTVNYFSARTGRPYAHEFVRNGEQLEIAGRYQLSVNESNASIAAVLAGLGIAQSPSFSVQPYLASGELVRVLPEWSRPALPI